MSYREIIDSFLEMNRIVYIRVSTAIRVDDNRL